MAQLFLDVEDRSADSARTSSVPFPNILQDRTEFWKTLDEWSPEPYSKDSRDIIRFCMYKALKYFPDKSDDILYNYLNYIFRLPLQEREAALVELRQHCQRNFLESEKAIRDVALILLPRWHFRMVNDYQRNMAYYKALLDYNIDRCNIKALDIGAGCGLLSLLASNNSKIDKMIAIESNKSLAVISKKVFADNQKHNIQVIAKHSTDLKAADVDGRADLLVTEIFDVALFGEHCLETLIHAWENLLVADACVIPASANLYVTGICCPDVLSKQSVVLNIPELFPNVRIDSIFTEPYDALDLKNVDWIQLTNTRKILTVDFHDVNQMKELFNADEKIHFELDCIENGMVNAFAVWFDLFLDKNTKITTNPQEDNARCWEQAIFCVKNPIRHVIGDKLKLNFTCRDSCVKIGLDTPYCLPKGIINFQVPQDIVRYLNDSDIFNQMIKLSEAYTAPIKLIDLSPFPLFGLLMARKGSICFCQNRDDSYTELILHFMDYWKIQKEALNILSDEELYDVITKANDFDVVLIDVISEYGTLNEGIFQNLESFKKCLKPDGVLLPKEVTLKFQIISCDYLHYCSRVNDSTTYGFQIADQINALAINEQWAFDKDMKYTPLAGTGSIVLSMDNTLSTWVSILKIAKSGIPHGVLYWFDLVYSDNIKVDTLCSTFYNSACFIIYNENQVVSSNVRPHIVINRIGGLLNICCSFKS